MKQVAAEKKTKKQGVNERKRTDFVVRGVPRQRGTGDLEKKKKLRSHGEGALGSLNDIQGEGGHVGDGSDRGPR